MTILLILAILNAAYVAALPSATVFYVANVLLHLVLGSATAAFLVWRYRRTPRALPLPPPAPRPSSPRRRNPRPLPNGRRRHPRPSRPPLPPHRPCRRRPPDPPPP